MYSNNGSTLEFTVCHRLSLSLSFCWPLPPLYQYFYIILMLCERKEMQKKTLLPNFLTIHPIFSHSCIDPENGQFKKENTPLFTIITGQCKRRKKKAVFNFFFSLSLSLFRAEKAQQRWERNIYYIHQEVIMISLIAFHGRIWNWSIYVLETSVVVFFSFLIHRKCLLMKA